MKIITQALLLVVLILVVIEASAFVWSSLFTYWTGLTEGQIEVIDAFCVSGNRTMMFIRNTGDSPVRMGEVSVLLLDSGDDVTGEVEWAGRTGAAVESIGPGGWASGTHPCAGSCGYRLVYMGRSTEVRPAC